MLKKLLNAVKLLRPQQWYKNIVVILALFFTWGFFDLDKNVKIVVGFFVLCLLSSFNYIVNDILDAPKDRIHPEKKKRPIASGKIKVYEAMILAIVLLISGLTVAFILGFDVFILMIIFLVFSSLYSFYLKHIPVLDIIMISLNFIFRAMAGVYILDVRLSPWLIVCTFLTAVFLAISKRQGDLVVLGEKAKKHKKTLKFYSKVNLKLWIYSIGFLLLLSYSFYTAFTGRILLTLTIPFACMFILRFLYHVKKGDEISRRVHLFIKDINMNLILLIWGILVVVIEYYYIIK